MACIAIFYAGFCAKPSASPAEMAGKISEQAKILFVGDMMFDRTIRFIADNQDYDSLFSCVSSYLKSFDLVVGNLEGPITLADSVSASTKPGDPGNTAFTFSPLAVFALSEHNVLAVNLGNNHIFDRGEAGLESTKKFLEEGGVKYFGVPNGDIATTTVVNGKEIGLVGFSDFFGENNFEKTTEAIKSLKAKNNFVVVYAHWGEEYVPENTVQKTLAYSFINAGADMVIGSHPHVVQGSEIYNGKRIYYSLGNFIFDQYWDKSVATGMGIELTLDKKMSVVNEQLFSITREGGTCIMQYDEG
jgi:poly-gamma-glutamate synthesis protein (capsule biosynthesis protein)